MIETKDPFDYILPHIVSIGPALEDELLAPYGSGTFVKFLLMLQGKLRQIYGIITASHVIEEIEFLRNFKNKTDYIGVLKPYDRSGNTYNEIHPFRFIYTAVDNSYFRKLVQKHFSGNCKNERDIAFICLGIDKITSQSVLLKESAFFDLNANPKLDLPKEHDGQMVFYKGACLDHLITDRVIATELVIEQGGVQKRYPKSQIAYHQIPNTTNRSMKGASGAALWVFARDTQNEIQKIFKGIIVEGTDSTTNAIDISYINGVFLPGLEDMVNKNHAHIFSD